MPIIQTMNIRSWCPATWCYLSWCMLWQLSKEQKTYQYHAETELNKAHTDW